MIVLSFDFEKQQMRQIQVKNKNLLQGCWITQCNNNNNNMMYMSHDSSSFNCFEFNQAFQ
jgi:hypothetical protein